MWWIVGFSVLIGILYLVLITIFSIGWKRINVFSPSEDGLADSLISVVVPCRDEENQICKLIASLKKQTYKNFELILVNDHSEDATRSYIEAALPGFKNVRLVDAIGSGKKNALREGILQSRGDLIVTTDADCSHSNRWLQTIAAFQNKYPSDLVICPVRLSGNNSLFSNIQQLEFVSLVASGAGAAGAGMPVLCNGANLVFTKEIWRKSQADLHDEEQSGDDIFLLQSVKKQGGVIRFLKSETAFAVAESADSLKSFFKQRRRWTSKAPAYTDWQIIFTACVIFTISFLEVILLCLSFFDSIYVILFLSVFAFKYLLDVLFMSSIRAFFKQKRVCFNSLALSVVYPFYIVMVGASALIIKPKNWK